MSVLIEYYAKLWLIKQQHWHCVRKHPLLLSWSESTQNKYERNMLMSRSVVGRSFLSKSQCKIYYLNTSLFPMAVGWYQKFLTVNLL